MTPQIDWPALLGDLAHLMGEQDGPDPAQRAPCSQERLASALGVPRGTLRGWMDGSEPRHADGERLLDAWSRHTGKARMFAPLERRPLSAVGR